jgi:hypothetical protein
MRKLVHTHDVAQGERKPRNRFLGAGVLAAGIALPLFGCAGAGQNVNAQINEIRFSSEYVMVQGHELRTVLIAPALQTIEEQHERREGFYGQVSRVMKETPGDYTTYSTYLAGIGGVVVGQKDGDYRAFAITGDPGHIPSEDERRFGAKDGTKITHIPEVSAFIDIVTKTTGKTVEGIGTLVWVDRQPHSMWTAPYSAEVVTPPTMDSLARCGQVQNDAPIKDYHVDGVPYRRGMAAHVYVFATDADGRIQGRTGKGTIALRVSVGPCPQPTAVFSEVVLLQEPKQQEGSGPHPQPVIRMQATVEFGN